MQMKRRMMAGALLALLTLLTGPGARAQEQPEAPKDWAKFGFYADQNEALKATGVAPDAVFMGNSITAGWARRDPQFFTRNNFAGRGIGGQTTAEMLVRFRQDVLELHPKVVLIMAGTNDIAMNNGWISLENALGNIVSMCELAKLHGIEVILCSVPPAFRFRWRPELEPAQTIVQFNSMIRRYAEEQGICYLDYWSSLADERGGIPAKWCGDEVHPNTQCYIEVFEPLALAAVNRVLGTQKSYVSPLPQE